MQVTDVAAGVVRALSYVSIALLAGVLVFVRGAAPPPPEPATAGTDAHAGRLESRRSGATGDTAFARRIRLLLTSGAATGALTGVLGILLIGAQREQRSLWDATTSHIVATTLQSRAGWVWAARTLLDALALGALVARPRGRTMTVALVAAAAFATVSPALAGHAATQSPVWAFVPADILHVAAAAVWAGGIAAIVLALPAATRAAATPARRTAILVDVLGRFSSLALAAVAAIVVTGLVQAYVAVRTVHALTHTTYGELVLLKGALVCLLVGLGVVNRERVIPALRRLLEAAAEPGGAGALLRRTTRGELAATASVFGVTAALVAFSPPAARQAWRVALRQAPAASRTVTHAPSAGGSRLAITVPPISAVNDTREPVSEPSPTGE